MTPRRMLKGSRFQFKAGIPAVLSVLLSKKEWAVIEAQQVARVRGE